MLILNGTENGHHRSLENVISSATRPRKRPEIVSRPRNRCSLMWSTKTVSAMAENYFSCLRLVDPPKAEG